MLFVGLTSLLTTEDSVGRATILLTMKAGVGCTSFFTKGAVKRAVAVASKPVGMRGKAVAVMRMETRTVIKGLKIHHKKKFLLKLLILKVGQIGKSLN